MTQPLNVVAEPRDVSSGVRQPDTVAGGLADILADTYMLTYKTHAYHWNVEGPLFYSIHNLTEGQYEDMFAAADTLAERIRAVGQMAPMSMGDIRDRSVVDDSPEKISAGDMCKALAADHERIAHRLHALIKMAGDNNDPVTEDLATERSAFHEQAAWMLKALVAE
ncbi:DNA starvation/stationary phase protection protein [Yoonia sp. F2084L]|uniref:Dps family protein n=1 Tax=Yoonia sp. F2084L TaxID=2926419 RepID=UPI001FF37137|nr:DNA starvation/stationary phase protection protein [Yoonia sp. F2084L]MCK0097704.1 DNA starvation/stationary phase protection protein [Yoonia sp. F2084L]